MKRRAGLSLGILVVLVAIVGIFFQGNGTKAQTSFPVRQFSTPNLVPQIEALEKRDLGPADKAALARLYVRQAKVTGDVTWYDKAEAMAKSSLPTFGAKLALSEVLEKRHLFADSIRLAKEVLAENPADPEALAAYATVSLAVGEIDEASRAIDLAVRAHPVPPLFALRALVLTARGRDLEAAAFFRRAIEAEDGKDAPDAAYNRAIYARFLTTKGRYEEARELIEDSLRIIPGQHLALSISGDLHLKQKAWEKAAKDFSDAFAASPQVSYLRKFSRAKRMLKDERGADDAMREALALARKEIKSGVHAHPLELGYALIAGKDPAGWQEAIQAATDELKVRHSVLPYVVLAQANEKAGNWEGATQAIDQVLRTGVRNPDYYMTAAKIAKGAGDSERARFYFEAALAEDRNLTEAEEGIRALASIPAKDKKAE